MQLVPVLDLMAGRVVRGVAGRREQYEPNRSCLVDSSSPLATCQAFVTQFAPEWIYVADLDGISAATPQLELLEELAAQPVKLAVDAGVTSPETGMRLLDAGASRVIVGLETLPELGLLDEFLAAVGPDRMAFSVDLNEGNPLRTWPGLETPEEIVRQAVSRGVHHLVVLDLAGVGVFQGVATSRLCGWIKQWSPATHIWTGAGVRSVIDLQELAALRIDGVLVASALHEGRITPEDWRNFRLADDASISLWADE